jgi:phosphoribosylformylglycinamidine synthase
MDKGTTDLILIDLGRGKNRMGASILAQTHGKLGKQAPDVDDAEDLKAFFAVIQGLNADGHLLAYHDRSDGGLLTTVVEMAFAGHCGLDLVLDSVAECLRDQRHPVQRRTGRGDPGASGRHAKRARTVQRGWPG